MTPCVFRSSVTSDSGIVTSDSGIVTKHSGFVTKHSGIVTAQSGVSDPSMPGYSDVWIAGQIEGVDIPRQQFFVMFDILGAWQRIQDVA